MNGFELITLLSELSTISTGVVTIAKMILAIVSTRGRITKASVEDLGNKSLQDIEGELQQREEMTSGQLYGMHNFLMVVEKAKTYYSDYMGTTEESGRTYNFDWFMRFYEAVGNVSEEYLQEFWAKLLAGEVKQPSTYSLRLVDTLKNMSTQEARLFEYIGPHVIRSESGKLALPNFKTYREYFKINYEDILNLSEAGVIYMEGALTGELKVKKRGSVFYINKNTAIDIRTTNEEAMMVKIREFPLTKVGMELYSLLGTETSGESFLMFCNEINKIDGVSAKVCKAEKMEKGSYKLTM